MCIRFEDSLLTCCCSISDWGKEKNWSGGGGGGEEKDRLPVN